MTEQPEKYEVIYPFHRHFLYGQTFELTWKIGAYYEAGQYDYFYAAHALGKMVITEIGRFKPKGFQTRVFFTRDFITPDGDYVKINRCHVSTLGRFRPITERFLHDYSLIDFDEKSLQCLKEQHKKLFGEKELSDGQCPEQEVTQ